MYSLCWQKPVKWVWSCVKNLEASQQCVILLIYRGCMATRNSSIKISKYSVNLYYICKLWVMITQIIKLFKSKFSSLHYHLFYLLRSRLFLKLSYHPLKPSYLLNTNKSRHILLSKTDKWTSIYKYTEHKVYPIIWNANGLILQRSTIKRTKSYSYWINIDIINCEVKFHIILYFTSTRLFNLPWLWSSKCFLVCIVFCQIFYQK